VQPVASDARTVNTARPIHLNWLFIFSLHFLAR
jgi:hypothetical protein